MTIINGYSHILHFLLMTDHHHRCSGGKTYDFSDLQYHVPHLGIYLHIVQLALFWPCILHLLLQSCLGMKVKLTMNEVDRLHNLESLNITIK
jgi:hypothetical protein